MVLCLHLLILFDKIINFWALHPHLDAVYFFTQCSMSRESPPWATLSKQCYGKCYFVLNLWYYNKSKLVAKWDLCAEQHYPLSFDDIIWCVHNLFCKILKNNSENCWLARPMHYCFQLCPSAMYLRYQYYSCTFLPLFIIVITFLFWNSLITVMYYVNPGSSTGEICPVERSRNCSHGKNLCGGWCWKSSVKSKVRQFLYICVFVQTQRRFLSVIIIRMYLSIYLYSHTHTHTLTKSLKSFF